MKTFKERLFITAINRLLMKWKKKSFESHKMWFWELMDKLAGKKEKQVKVFSFKQKKQELMNVIMC